MWEHLFVAPLPPLGMAVMEAREPVTAIFAFALLTVLLLPSIVVVSGRGRARCRVALRRLDPSRSDEIGPRRERLRPST